jgi:teichuronic acid biosynthesis glycosyltransferase TuaG
VAVHDNDLRAPVSVIVPAYNAATTIGRALASVARQSIKPHEVIVVDDGSVDGTAAIARDLAATTPAIRVAVLSQPNLGAGAARNRALAEARAPLIAFLDADDEWLPEKLEASLPYFDRDELILVAHNGWLVHDGREVLIDIARRFRAAAANPYAGLYRRGFIATSSVVARRSAIAEVGGFDETLRTGQDFDLWLRLLKRANAGFLVFDRALTRHHVTPGSITSHTGRRLANTMEIAIRHAPDLADHGASPLIGLWFRVLAVHAEAMQAYRRRGEFREAAVVAAALPSALLGATRRVLRASRTSVWRPAAIAAGLYLWVAAAFAAYMWQFSDMIGSVARLLGL